MKAFGQRLGERRLRAVRRYQREFVAANARQEAIDTNAQIAKALSEKELKELPCNRHR
jgi:hypothetical protein